ncbi:hypothetical protein L0F63_000968 [Massospora cicadina]|nr:hypothetical protein L0F63_000968 [Massospora cicadina]
MDNSGAWEDAVRDCANLRVATGAVHFDVNFIFAVNFTSDRFDPKLAKLHASPRFVVPPGSATSETHFTVFAAHSFKAEGAGEARAWVMRLRAYLSVRWADKGTAAPKFFMVLNPFGGGRKAQSLFDTVTRPMLQLAGIGYDLFVTQHFQHGLALTQKATNLAAYDAIVSIGGDGAFHEVVNGALTREDWEQVVKVPFGILPAGSANGVAASLGIGEFHLASLNLIRGNAQKYDIGALYCASRGDRITYSVLDSVSGYLSDVDELADRLRWLGPFRLVVAAFIRALLLKSYRTRVHFLPAVKNTRGCVRGEKLNFHTVIEVGPTTRDVTPGPKPTIPNVIKGYSSVTDSISERLTDDWIVADGALSVTAITNVPFLSKGFRVSKLATTSNGWVTLVTNRRPLSGLGLLSALLREAINPGKGNFQVNMREAHAHCVIVESLGEVVSDKPAAGVPKTPNSQVVGDRLIGWDPKKPGTFRVDGEVLKGTDTIQVQVMPGLLTLIYPPW